MSQVLSGPLLIQIRGCACAYRLDAEDVPVLFNMNGSEEAFVPIFSSRTRLMAEMDRLGICFYEVRYVEEPRVFMATAARAGYRLILDPTRVDDRLRWIEVRPPTLGLA